MAELLRRSLLWRLIQAVLRFASGLGETSRALGFLSRRHRSWRAVATGCLSCKDALLKQSSASVRQELRKTRL